MAINVNYGDISSALGLALQGGQAVRQRTQQQQDQQFLQMVGEEQARADAQHAQQVSQALGVQEKNADLTMQQRHMDQSAQQDVNQNALHQQQLQQQAAEAQARMAQAQATSDQAHKYQDADQRMQEQAFQDKQKSQQEKDAAIASLTPEQQAVVKATGRMPYVPNSGDSESAAFKQLESESRRLGSIVQQYEANRAKDFRAQLSNAPEPAQIAQARQQKAQLDDELAKRSQGIVQNGTLNNARLAQTAVEQRQQQPAANQSAPAQQPRILAVERNPQDGKLWGYTEGQGWAPLHQ